jgi:hypothetical protein
MLPKNVSHVLGIPASPECCFDAPAQSEQSTYASRPLVMWISERAHHILSNLIICYFHGEIADLFTNLMEMPCTFKDIVASNS